MTRKTTLLLLLLCMSYNAFAQCYSSSKTSASTIIARQTDGTLWAKGLNLDATMGNGTTTSSGTFVQIGTGNNWTDNYSINFYHALAIKTDGTLWAWGTDNSQLGIGTTATTATGTPVVPTQVGTDANWTTVATGMSHSLAIKSNGTLWAWGSNQEGQLGTGTLPVNSWDYELTPIQVGTDNHWLKVFANSSYSFAIKTDGTLWSWGGGIHTSNNYYALGYVSSGNDYLQPHQVGTATNWATVAIGGNFAAAIQADGTLWVWGYNGSALFGNNTPIGVWTTNLLPIQLGTDTNWADIKLSYSNDCLALKTNGTRWGWGRNSSYNLGNSTNADLLVPTQLDTDTDWLYIDLYNSNTVIGAGIKQDYSLYRWGHDLVSATYLQIPTLQGTSCALSINGFENENILVIYPNPVTSIATINFATQKTEIASFVISNSLGQVIYNSKSIDAIGKNQINIDFSNYSSGVYIITLQTENYNCSTKIIKQ